jgi:hypothetical protein
MVPVMTPSELSDRDRRYLDAFPITEDLTGLFGPDIPGVVIGPDGLSVPEGDYESWTAITASGRELPVPQVICQQLQRESPHGRVWYVEFGDAPKAERNRLWRMEMTRVRDRINELAAQLTS